MPKTRSTTARAIIVLRRLCPTQDLICKQVLINLIFILVSLQTISYTQFVLVLFYNTEISNNPLKPCSTTTRGPLATES